MYARPFTIHHSHILSVLLQSVVENFAQPCGFYIFMFAGPESFSEFCKSVIIIHNAVNILIPNWFALTRCEALERAYILTLLLWYDVYLVILLTSASTCWSWCFYWQIWFTWTSWLISDNAFYKGKDATFEVPGEEPVCFECFETCSEQVRRQRRRSGSVRPWSGL